MRRLLVFAFAAAVVLAGCGGFSFEAKIPKNVIIEQLVRRFPIERHKGLLSLTISDPKLDFSVGNNRIGVKAHTVARFLGIIPVEGETIADGTLQYAPELGAFKFVDVKVTKFQVKDISEDKVDEITSLVGSVIATNLGGLEIYKLDSSKIEEKLASLVLRDIHIVEDGVMVRLGVGR